MAQSLKTAAEVLAERQHQIEIWGPEHDQSYNGAFGDAQKHRDGRAAGELGLAGAALVLNATGVTGMAEALWPKRWDEDGYQLSRYSSRPRREQLKIAAALIMAQMDVDGE